jgi:uncharacterized membrane protein YgcG
MENKMKTLRFVSAMFLLSIFSLVLPVSAQATCSQRVSDESGLLGNRASEVNQLAQQLVEDGVDLHVVVIRSFNIPRSDNELNIYKEQLLSLCPQWGSAETNVGLTQNGILLFASLSETRGAIYFGPEWVNELDGKYVAIARQHMNPSFEREDMAGGVIAGLIQIGESIGALSVNTQSQTNSRPDFMVLLIGAVVIVVVVIFVVAGLQNASKPAVKTANYHAYSSDPTYRLSSLISEAATAVQQAEYALQESPADQLKEELENAKDSLRLARKDQQNEHSTHEEGIAFATNARKRADRIIESTYRQRKSAKKQSESRNKSSDSSSSFWFWGDGGGSSGGDSSCGGGGGCGGGGCGGGGCGGGS